MSRRRTQLQSTRLRSERGAAIIHVSLVLLVLLGFSAWVFDSGVFWLSRRQAQNVADAAALAGILSRTDELPTMAGKPTEGANGAAQQSAELTVAEHYVFGEAPAATVRFELQTLTGPASCQPANDPTNGVRCVQVDVYRDTANTNPLPTFFANILGITSQNIRATATAQLMSATWNSCLKPWMVMDKWGPDVNGNGVFDPNMGEYTDGYQVPQDIGTVITLAAGNPSQALSPSEYYRIDLTGGGSAAYVNNISTCAGVTPTDTFLVLPGGGPGPLTHQAVRDDLHYGTIVPIAVFSPEEWYTAPRVSGRLDLHIVKILGFEIISSNNSGQVVGKIVQTVGEINSTSPLSPTVGGGFLLAPVLVR